MSSLAVSANPFPVIDAPLVPLVGGEEVRYANFDHAASTPCLRVAADAVTALLPTYASVHRGAGYFSQSSTRAYEDARATIGRFVNARPDDAVIFTRNSTDSLNLLARALPADCTVIAFDSEHHANLLPWRNLIRLPAPDSRATAVRSVHEALRFVDGPALVAVTGASNVTGELFPVAEIALIARRHGARVVVDAAQLAPHRAVDVQALGADYVVFSGHKLYAPFGTGVLIGRTDWLDAAEPYLYGGGASAHVGDATNDLRWHTGAARHEGGSPNVVGAVALAAVCESLMNADRAALFAWEETLRTRLADGLTAIPGVRQLHIFGPQAPRVGTVAFTVDGYPADLVAAVLSAEHGIGVRDGLFCAHPLTRRLLTEAGVAPTHSTGCGTTGRPQVVATAVRASIGLGITVDDVDRLIAAVATLAADGPRWTYSLVDGRPGPVPDPRPVA
ncbi:aminotransferase [Actinorhabdospora filicis]|uniref:Aminotransferase n=1 Tax=Actinorhabdospora filicis TaxID=1785913 RepID=A0A9W6SMD9_9ACTN|nr:aminotransferase [Actinorhabdospora filicis]